jgi:TorA maturation chaperone TorD
MNNGNETIKPILYTVLAEAYKYELNEQRLGGLLELLEQIQADEPELQAIVNNLKESLQVVTIDRENGLLSLGIEYMNIFRGAGSNPVFLYEAVHRSEDGLMYEEPYFEVKAAYEKLGFEIEADWIEPDDHLAVECQFLAYLGEQVEQERTFGDGEKLTFLCQQREGFLRDHFLTWVPEFSEQLLQNTSHNFYEQVARLTKYICKKVSIN